MEHLQMLAVIGYCLGLALFTEVAQYLVVYRTTAFQTLKANLEKHSKKLEEAKGASASKNLKKKQARLETWQDAAGRQIVAINWKAGTVAMVILLLGFKFLNKWWGGQVVGRLPFHPLPFFQKVTHRGLEGANATDCSALFIYMLFQASVRPMLSKALGWGPSNAMLSIKPTIPRALQFGFLKEK